MSQELRAYQPFSQPYGYQNYPMTPHHYGAYPMSHPYGYHHGYHDGYYHGYQHALDLHVVHVHGHRNPTHPYIPTDIN
jgi:hypothetical protein